MGSAGKDMVTLHTGKSYDVIVVGGGIAGVSAAVAARRQGRDRKSVV